MHLGRSKSHSRSSLIQNVAPVGSLENIIKIYRITKCTTYTGILCFICFELTLTISKNSCLFLVFRLLPLDNIWLTFMNVNRIGGMQLMYWLASHWKQVKSKYMYLFKGREFFLPNVNSVKYIVYVMKS